MTERLTAKLQKFKNLSLILGWSGLRLVLLGSFLGFVSAMIEYSLVGFLQVFLVKQGFTNSEVSPALQRFTLLSDGFLAFSLIAIGLIRALVVYYSEQIAYVSAEITTSKLKLVTLYHVLLTKYPPFSSQVFSLFSDFFPRAKLFVFSLSLLFTSIIQVTLILAGMFYLSWYHTCIAILLLGFIWLIIRKINQKVKEISAENPKIMTAMSSDLENVIKNRPFVLVSGMERTEYQSLVQKMLNSYLNYRHARHYVSIASAVPTFFGTVIIALLIMYSQKAGMSGVKFISFLYLFLRFIQQISQLVAKLGDAISNYPGLVMIAEYTNQFEPAQLMAAVEPANLVAKGAATIDIKKIVDADTVKASTERMKSSPGIEFENMSFSWKKNSDVPLFNKFNLKIAPNERFILTGRSGVGKSTLLQLVLGLEEPSHGRILVDHLTPKEFLTKFHNDIGFVGPDPFIIEGSIRENLLYGNKQGCSDDELSAWLGKLGLLEIILALPKGLSTKIAHNKDFLSTGQKQRLSIVRALIKKPKLLLLDEATANLDYETESRIIDIFKDLSNCTIVAVTHRKSFMRLADTLICLSCNSSDCKCNQE